MARDKHGFRAETWGDESRRMADGYVHALTTIDGLHRMAHDGMVFHASGKVTGMINANVDEFLVAVPAVTFPHFQRFRITAGRGDIDVQVYEGTTTSADGTPITTQNTNRNSTNTPSTVLTSAPTITDDGTLVHTSWMPPTGTGTGQSANGLVGETNGEEWILKPATKYLVRITNNSGATIDYAYEMLWYEVSYDH